MPQKRDHAVLPALALRRGQALRLLDHRQLPRGLRHATPATASCSTTRARCAARPSSRARSRAPWPRIELGLQDCLYLGNLDAQRDWGHARDYVEAHVADAAAGRSPRTSCIATGEQHIVREFVELRRRRARHQRDRVARARGVDESGRSTAQTGEALVRDRPALLPPDRGRHAAGRSRARPRPSSAGRPQTTLRRAGARDGRSATSSTPPSATAW